MANAEPQSKISKAKSECCRIKTREAEFLNVSQNRETRTNFHKRQAKSYKVGEKNQKGNEYAESASGEEQNRKTKKRHTYHCGNWRQKQKRHIKIRGWFLLNAETGGLSESARRACQNRTDPRRNQKAKPEMKRVVQNQKADVRTRNQFEKTVRKLLGPDSDQNPDKEQNQNPSTFSDLSKTGYPRTPEVT